MAAAPERDNEIDLERVDAYNKQIKQRSEAYQEQMVSSASGPIMLTAVAGALTLMGGIGLTGDPSETAYRVIFTIGSALFVVGILLLRRARARWIYRITKRFSPLRLLAAIGMAVGIVGAGYLIAYLTDIRVFAGVGLFVGLPAALRFYGKHNTAVSITQLGAGTGAGMVPWDQISHIVVTDPAGGSPEIGTRFIPGAEVASLAGLPDHDPSDPSAPQVSVEVQARKLDLVKLGTAVA